MTDPIEPIDLRSEAALDAFIAGLDSPWHSAESRRAWCRLFLRDAALGYLRLAPLPRWGEWHDASEPIPGNRRIEIEWDGELPTEPGAMVKARRWRAWEPG